MTSLFPHLPGVEPAAQFESLEAQVRALECFETDPWAARAILQSELLTRDVVDPCCGTGILSVAARENGYDTYSNDIVSWGYSRQTSTVDFLSIDTAHELIADWRETDFSVFMNPPFSKACAFVDKALALGARKIVCFQRFAWWESAARRDWWSVNPPQRLYICGDRASCWRFDVPPEGRTGKSTPTAHAWFVWERSQPPGPVIGHVWRDQR